MIAQLTGPATNLARHPGPTETTPPGPQVTRSCIRRKSPHGSWRTGSVFWQLAGRCRWLGRQEPLLLTRSDSAQPRQRAETHLPARGVEGRGSEGLVGTVAVSVPRRGTHDAGEVSLSADVGWGECRGKAFLIVTSSGRARREHFHSTAALNRKRRAGWHPPNPHPRCQWPGRGPRWQRGGDSPNSRGKPSQPRGEVERLGGLTCRGVRPHKLVVLLAVP